MASIGLIALIGAIAAPVCGLVGTWYGARRAAQAQEREVRRRSDVALQQIEKVDAVDQAHRVLVGTIDKMREELKRQDQEHAGAITELRGKLEALRVHNEECERERLRLQQRVWELEHR